MKVVIEVVVDEAEDAVLLIREAAAKLKKGTIVSGETVNYCLGDYRVTLFDESIDVVNKMVAVE